MRVKIFVILIFFISFNFLTAEVERRTRYYSNNNPRRVNFYKGRNRIGVIRYNRDGSIRRKRGTIPNGISVEYTSNNQIANKMEFQEQRLIMVMEYSNNIQNGKYKEFYLSGNIKCIGNYKDGKRQGEFQEYYENGNLKIKSYYKNGKLEGIVKEYSPENILISSISYRDNKKNGVSKKYSASGKLLKEQNFKNDLLQGETIKYRMNGTMDSKKVFNRNDLISKSEYYENGNLKIKSYYKNGKLEGIVKEYSPENILISSISYRDNKKNGVSKKYTASGKLLKEQNYRNDFLQGETIKYRMNGTMDSKKVFNRNNLISKIEYSEKIEDYIVKTFYLNGRIKTKQNYQNNKLHSMQIEYYSSGDTKIITNYQNGIKTGKYKEYFITGKLKNIGEYSNNLKEGEFKEYYSNGNIKKIENYKNNEFHGIMKVYYNSGEIKSEKKYVNGKLEGVVVSYSISGEKTKDYYRNGVQLTEYEVLKMKYLENDKHIKKINSERIRKIQNKTKNSLIPGWNNLTWGMTRKDVFQHFDSAKFYKSGRMNLGKINIFNEKFEVIAEFQDDLLSSLEIESKSSIGESFVQEVIKYMYDKYDNPVRRFSNEQERGNILASSKTFSDIYVWEDKEKNNIIFISANVNYSGLAADPLMRALVGNILPDRIIYITFNSFEIPILSDEEIMGGL